MIAVLLSASCGGGGQGEGLAITGAGGTNPGSGSEDTAVEGAVDETTASTAAHDGTTDDPADDPADGGSAAGGEAVVSPSERQVLDRNHTIPETLTLGLAAGEIRNLVIDVHGPTDDVAAELNRIGIFPPDFPTHPGSDIHEFTMRLSTQLDPAEVRAEVTIHVDAPPADVIALFETALTEPEYSVVGTGNRTEDDLEIRSIELATQTSEENYKQGLSIDVVTGDFAGTFVVASFHDILTPGQRVQAIDLIAALQPWNEDAPIPAGGTPRSSWVQSSLPLLSFGPGIQYLRIAYDLDYPGTPGQALAADAYGALAGSPYTVRTFDGDPPPDEALSTAVADGENYVSYSLEHPDRESAPRLVVWNLDPERGDGWLEFDGGTIDLFEAP